MYTIVSFFSLKHFLLKINWINGKIYNLVIFFVNWSRLRIRIKLKQHNKQKCYNLENTHYFYGYVFEPESIYNRFLTNNKTIIVSVNSLRYHSLSWEILIVKKYI